MKKLLALLMLLIASLSYAANGFQLKYTDNEGTITILDNSKDWVKVYESSGMTLYLNDGGFAEANGYKVMHSKITYKTPQEFVGGQKIHHIYSYGLVDCKKGVLYLIGDLYTNDKFEMIYKKDFSVGEFVSDLKEPNTARNDVYGVICIDEII